MENHAENKEDSNVGIRREAVEPSDGSKKRRSYRKDASIPRQIVELLAKQYAAEHVAKLLDISPSQVHRYKNEALRLGILVDYCGLNPRLYEKGPRYNLKNERGWWSLRFEPIECRVHKGQGSSYTAYVGGYSNFEEISYRLEDGTVENRPLFVGCSHRSKGYTIHKCRFPLPKHVVGYVSSAYLEARKFTNGNVMLNIGPPPIQMSFSELEEMYGEDPFWYVLLYIEDELRLHGHWWFNSIEDHGSTHYAFDASRAQLLCPDLLQGVHRLRRGDNEENFIIYLDKSTPSGELETTSQRIARDILGILQIECRRANCPRSRA